MQDPEHGVPVRSQKLFFTDIPAAFMGEFVFNIIFQKGIDSLNICS